MCVCVYHQQIYVTITDKKKSRLLSINIKIAVVICCLPVDDVSCCCCSHRKRVDNNNHNLTTIIQWQRSTTRSGSIRGRLLLDTLSLVRHTSRDSIVLVPFSRNKTKNKKMPTSVIHLFLGKKSCNVLRLF